MRVERYKRIGEVSRVIGEHPYVLRYWEACFKIKPFRTSKDKRRAYDLKAVEEFGEVYRLLRVEKYSIEGARIKLRTFRRKRKLSAGLIEHEIR